MGVAAAELRIDAERAQRILDQTPFTRAWGYRIDSVTPGSARVRLPFREEFVRPGGTLQGACAMGAADVAFWIALMTVVGEEPLALTIQMTTSFLRGARGDLLCDATVLRAGRRIAFGEARTFDGSGELVAHHTLTYIREERR